MLFGKKPKLVDVKAKPEDPEDWQWVFILFGGKHSICEAEVSNLAELPKSFRIRKLMDFKVEGKAHPDVLAMVAEMRAEAQRKIDEKSEDCSRRMKFRQDMAGQSEHDLKRFDEKMRKELDEFAKQTVAAGQAEAKKKAESMPGSSPVAVPTLDEANLVIDGMMWVPGASVGIAPVDPDLAERCADLWAKREARLAGNGGPVGAATVYDEKPLPDSKPMTPEMEARAQAGLANMASQMARAMPKAEA